MIKLCWHKWSIGAIQYKPIEEICNSGGVVQNVISQILGIYDGIVSQHYLML